MKKKEYLIDVASERHYQNQTRTYRKAFTEWRNSPNNRFGYRFVHDSREHTYIDGEGFADKQCITAETRSLHTCLQFLGAIMLIDYLLEILTALIMLMMFGKTHVSWVFFSQRTLNYIIPAEQMFVYCGLRVFTLTAVITIGNMILKLPRQVCLPHKRQKLPRLAYGISIILLLTMILRMFDYNIGEFFYSVNIDTIYYTYMNSSSDASQVMYFVSELVAVPILSEILFRGLILQLFRQFGDGFAVIISSIVCACCYHEPSKILFIFTLSVALGVFTIKNGSIYITAIMRVCTVNLLYLLNSLSIVKFKSTERFTEAIISTAVILVSCLTIIPLHSRLTRPYKLKIDKTELSFKLKLRQLLNSTLMVIWMICALIAVIISMRFI